MANTKKIAAGIFLLAFIVSVVSAVGVSTPYWNTNPLKLQPGESTTITLSLQNMVGDSNVTLKANVSKGVGIAELLEEGDYFVPLGRNDVPVNIYISVPENAEVDQILDIEVSFVQASEDEGGFFTVASAFTQRIPVLIVGNPTESITYGQKQEMMSPLAWVALVLVIAIVIGGLMARKKN